IGAPKAPAVDHRDGGLLIPAQPAPPGIGFPLRLAYRAESLHLGLAEILLEVHARRPGGALAGEHQHADIVPILELLEDAQHLAIELRAHAVALLGTIESHPGDAVGHGERNGIGFLSLCAHDDARWCRSGRLRWGTGREGSRW